MNSTTQHVKRIRFVATTTQKAHAHIEVHLMLAKELEALGYCAHISLAKNGFYADVKWYAPKGVSFTQLLAKYKA